MTVKNKIIGIHGKAHAGKDSFARMVIDIAHEELNKTFVRYGFADPIKHCCNFLMGWDERHAFGELKEVVDPKWGFSPRYAYQMFGTQFARKLLRDDFWLRVAEDKITGYTIIPDCRFDNEARFILEAGGLLVHIVRPSQSQISLSEHVSEAGLSPEILDKAFLINNDAGFEALEGHARVIVRNFCAEKVLDSDLFRSV